MTKIRLYIFGLSGTLIDVDSYFRYNQSLADSGALSLTSLFSAAKIDFRNTKCNYSFDDYMKYHTQIN